MMHVKIFFYINEKYEAWFYKENIFFILNFETLSKKTFFFFFILFKFLKK